MRVQPADADAHKMMDGLLRIVFLLHLLLKFRKDFIPHLIMQPLVAVISFICNAAHIFFFLCKMFQCITLEKLDALLAGMLLFYGILIKQNQLVHNRK